MLNQKAHLRAKCVQIKWLRQHVHAVIEEIGAGGILGVTADEKHFEIGARSSADFGKLPAANVRQHDVGH